MNMSFPSRDQVASIRKNYPLGTRVMLNNIGNRMYCDRFYKESCNDAGTFHSIIQKDQQIHTINISTKGVYKNGYSLFLQSA